MIIKIRRNIETYIYIIIIVQYYKVRMHNIECIRNIKLHSIYILIIIMQTMNDLRLERIYEGINRWWNDNTVGNDIYKRNMYAKMCIYY